MKPEKQKKTKIKTVILPDGTYGQQLVEESDEILPESQAQSKFRSFLINNSYLSSTMTRTILKILLALKDEPPVYDKYATNSLLMIIALLRYYHQNL